MENLRLLLVITILCAVVSNGLAQSRGSSRYSPADEESDGPSTPPQRSPPSRRASIRRRKPIPTPEPSEINKELPDYQLPKREETTARRVPSRVPAEEFAPHVPDVPVLPDEPILPAVVDELPQVTTAASEDKTQGRRRRPKKRRRPQNGAAKPTADTEKLDLTEPEKSKVPVSVPELLDTDQKRPEPFSVNPEVIRNPNKFDSPTALEEKSLWSDDKLVNIAGDSGRRNPEPASYYPPQVGTNRLPIEDTERIESARGHSESIPPTYLDTPNKRYSLPVDDQPSRASYVPVLTPIRAPTESRPRAQDFPESRKQENTRLSRPSDRRSPQRTSSNRSPPIPVPRVEDERTIASARAPQNFAPHNSQPSIPERALPEVRLPATESPLLANDFTDKPGFETAEELLERLQEEGNPAVEGIDLQGPDVASRLPNPGDVPFDDGYPPYSENIGSEERPVDVVPHRREEDIPPAPRTSFNDIQPQETPKRQSTNNVDTDGRQVSRYETPLQRGGFRSRGSERSEITRTNYEDKSRIQIPARGSTRYQSEASPEEFSRTRSASRSSSDSSSNTPTRSRSSQTPSQAPTQSRNTQRYHPDPAESRARVSARRQPVDTEYAEERPDDVDYFRSSPDPAHEEDSQYVPPPPRSAPVSAPDEEYIPVRSADRYRPPQYETRDTTEPHLHEELTEEQPDRNAYVPEYQAPREPSRRRPVDQRGPPLAEQSINPRGPPLREQVVGPRGPPVREQSERQVSRQTSRRENVGQRNAVRQPRPDYRAPEENTRHQPEYQAGFSPQNSRNQARPVPQNDPYQERQPAPRQQSRARQPEPNPNQGRASGSSKFTCPEAFGFFADPVQCDKYYECRNGTAVENLCNDGLAFNEVAAPKFLRCDSLRDVDCSSRPKLQEAKPTKNCPRKYGLYPNEADCTKFFNCVDGTATEVQCPPGLIFNDDRATCDWADLVKSSCKTEDLLGFSCPEASAHDLQDGVYTTYPHPDNCQLHFVCIKGDDGLRRPRMLTCHEGLVYNPTTKSCARPDGVPGCEDFYGSRSPPPKAQRTPAREPIREPVELDEYEEQPTPKPRRRVQNRRQRN